jgi:hypothetical protein
MKTHTVKIEDGQTTGRFHGPFWGSVQARGSGVRRNNIAIPLDFTNPPGHDHQVVDLTFLT